MSFKRSMYIFRRDLRLHDNKGLIQAYENSKEILPIFIFNPNLVGKRSVNKNIIQFMIESLKDLEMDIKNQNGKLAYFFGEEDEIIYSLITQNSIEAIYSNRDYTPFSRKRDENIRKLCAECDAKFKQIDDYMLNPPESIKTAKKTPYTIFTPYFKKAKTVYVDRPKSVNHYRFFKLPEKHVKEYSLNKFTFKRNNEIKISGGRNNALRILEHLEKYENYELERDYPALDKTTHLSAYLKFGVISIREAYHNIRTRLGNEHPLLRQLYWRDFFTQIGHFFPYVYKNSFRKKYDKIKWANDKELFNIWREGKTGFPIVDAGMRALNSTGYMHNRVRMIVASFLTKDLHLDWRWGMRYFAQKLVDHDLSLNNGNWQWAASTGCDAQPYFRIFNPWSQQKKFDKNCEYIKKWVPELRNLENKVIHKWNIYATKYNINYPEPVISHKKERIKALNTYKAVFS